MLRLKVIQAVNLLSAQEKDIQLDAIRNIIEGKSTQVQHTLLNAAIQYKWSNRIVLFANGQNLLNDQFNEIYGYNTIGRMIQFGIRLN